MRFGVEIELDAFDGRDFAAQPLGHGEMPAGASEVADIVAGLGYEVQTHGWKHNHNNSVWTCKPDSSCGIELCSPVLDEGGIPDVLRVMSALKTDPRVSAGEDCAFHVHVDVSEIVSGMPELSVPLCSVLAWWIKSEPIMLDSVPARRRSSRFCKCIGFTDLFDHEEKVLPCMAVGKLRDKYLTLNTHHLVARKRDSIEFRIMEGTVDPELAGPWIGFLLNFVGKASAAPMPDDYRWVSIGELDRLVESEDFSRWIRARILENSEGERSRFWRARLAAELPRLGGRPFFGRTASFLGPLRDK